MMIASNPQVPKASGGLHRTVVLRPAVAYRLRSRSRRFFTFERLVSQHAAALTCLRRSGGGSWSGATGDGEAWREGDRTWCWRRPIRRGQWAGPWQRQRVEDI